jgi:hypothetical protein
VGCSVVAASPGIRRPRYTRSSCQPTAPKALSNALSRDPRGQPELPRSARPTGTAAIRAAILNCRDPRGQPDLPQTACAAANRICRRPRGHPELSRVLAVTSHPADDRHSGTWGIVKLLFGLGALFMAIGVVFMIVALRRRFWELPPRSAGRLRLLGPAICCDLVGVILFVVASTRS